MPKTDNEKSENSSSYARSLIEASLDPLVTISAEGKITDVNKATELVTGCPRERLIGSDFSDYFTEPDKARAGYLQVFSQGFVKDYPLAIRHISGKTTYVLYNATVYKNQKGDIQGVFAAARDITDRREAEEKYRTLFQSIDEGFCIIQMVFDKACKPIDYRFLEVNASFERQTGLHEAKGELMRTLAPSHEQNWFDIYGKVALTGEPVRFTNEARALNRWYDVYAFPVGKEKIKDVAILFNDITDRKLVEDRLRAASLYSRTLLEASLDPLVTISAAGKITDVNEATEKATGYSREELIGSDFSDYFLEPEKARGGYKKVFTEGYVRDYPLAICHRSGKVTDVLYNASVYKNEAGQIQGVFAAARDVTERKKAEAALARQAELIDLTPDAFIVIDPEGNAKFWSLGAERLYGWKENEVFGKQIHAMLETKFPEPLESIMKKLKETSFWSGELLQRNKDGEQIIVQSRWIPRRDASGNIAEILKSNVDITARKKMESEIRETSEKLRQSNAELEQFAYVASHDLQEPLRMVASYVQLLERRYKGKLDSEADEFINYAVDGANRMRSLIDDLLTYSRVGRLGKPYEPTNLELTIEVVLKNLQTTIADNHAIVTHDQLPEVVADGGQLVQLFQNLIGNAIKFHGQEPPRVHVSVKEESNEYQFSVKDNGIGIEQQYFDRLFRIFQRLHTREEYPGSGIGLAICKKIVERHGGRIWIESQTGKGSTIHFTLTKKLEAPKNERS